MELKDWVDQNARRPILLAVLVVALLQAVSLCAVTWTEWGVRRAAMDRLAEAVSLGIQQHNRPLVETAVMGGLHAARFSVVALCRGTSPEMSYPPAAAAPCSSARLLGTTLMTDRELPGAPGYVLRFGIDLVVLAAPLAAFLGLSAALGLAVAAILMRARGRFSREILRPLAAGMNSEAPLEIAELDALRRRNLEYQDMHRRQAVMEALWALSAQVAHDIRSPLAALERVAASSTDLPKDVGSLLRSAVARIAAISGDLLSKERPVRLEPVSVRDTVDALLGEARCRPAAAGRVELDWDGEPPQQGILILADPVGLGRVLANLISNAIEAIDGPGRVMLRARATGRFVEVSVTDTGPGIPPEVAARLGERGATFGKAHGTGLGLYHAKTSVESWGGLIEFESSAGNGTTVRVQLPAAGLPGVAAPSQRPDAVLIDDDPLVRKTWALAAQRAGRRLEAYEGPAALLAAPGSIPKDVPVYIDSNLAGGVRGQDVASELARLGFREIHLETGDAPDPLAAASHIRSIRGKEPPWPLDGPPC